MVIASQPSVQYLNAVSHLIEETRAYLDGLGLIPRETSSTDSVLLALVSKSVTLTEAIVLLVSNGFHDEAFGLCRTCLEVELTVRYLTNTDTVSRCTRYARYFAKVNEGWVKITKRFYPDMTVKMRPDAAELAGLASNYKDPHRWSEHNLKYFASEPDSFEKREDGTPLDQLFYYEALYKWMSYYVHAAEPALDPFHITVPGDTFKVHPGAGQSTRGADALRMSYQFIHITLFRVLRYFNMSYPSALQDLYEQVLHDYVKP
jgi:Family of unknown function (DUF5677)